MSGSAEVVATLLLSSADPGRRLESGLVPENMAANDATRSLLRLFGGQPVEAREAEVALDALSARAPAGDGVPPSAFAELGSFAEAPPAAGPRSLSARASERGAAVAAPAGATEPPSAAAGASHLEMARRRASAAAGVAGPAGVAEAASAEAAVASHKESPRAPGPAREERSDVLEQLAQAAASGDPQQVNELCLSYPCPCPSQFVKHL